MRIASKLRQRQFGRILAFQCRKLEVLELNGCTKLTDDVVPILLNLLGSSLVYLDIVNCRSMTSNALHAVLQYVKVGQCNSPSLSCCYSFCTKEEGA